jgi:hypothetical protein
MVGRARWRRWGIRAGASLAAGLGLLVAVPHAAQAGTQQGTLRVSVSAGIDHTCALELGQAYCWGQNYSGGDTNSGVPVAVGNLGALTGQALTQVTVGGPACALDNTCAAY